MPKDLWKLFVCLFVWLAGMLGPRISLAYWLIDKQRGLLAALKYTQARAKGPFTRRQNSVGAERSYRITS